MWWCSGPAWGWGPPFWMFLAPLLFLLAMFLVFRFFRHNFAGCCGHGYMSSRPLAEEASQLRQEIDQLKRGKT